MWNVLFKSLGLLIVAATVLSGLVNAQDTREISWYTLEEAQEKSLESDKDIMVFAVTEWCVYCKAMDKEAFVDPDIVSLIAERFYPVRVDIESDRTVTFNGEKMTESQFAEKYQLRIPPKTLFLSSGGEVLFDYTGYISEEAFSQLLTAWSEREI
ncbi:thioredoxin family protein [Rhodohalobacter sp. 8-1]|uniref:thioredoxin family protein n=1 Tax=Rhodohalobacter sp. 8-1 TaxID=3131972 RepID=UPI0030EEA0EC